MPSLSLSRRTEGASVRALYADVQFSYCVFALDDCMCASSWDFVECVGEVRRGGAGPGRGGDGVTGSRVAGTWDRRP
jgi:hypothetical protein